MDNNEIIEYLKKLDSSVYIHSSNLLKKFSDWNSLTAKQKASLPNIANEYIKYLKGECPEGTELKYFKAVGQIFKV